MRVTQMRIFTALLAMLATLLTIAAFASNDWYVVSTQSQLSSAEVIEYSYGLFNYCVSGKCFAVKTNEGWRKAVIGLLAASIALSCFSIIAIFSVICCSKKIKYVSVTMLLSALLQLVALITFPLNMNLSSNNGFGLSYYVECVGMIVTCGAGLFTCASKEEQVAPFHDIAT